MAQDDVTAVAAFAHLGLIRTEMWPMVAAWLLDSRIEGPAVEGMASLDSAADVWDVDPLKADLMRELGTPTMDDDHAASVVGAAFALDPKQADLPTGHPPLRRLAATAPYLDCDDHPGGASEADLLEHRLRTGVVVDLNPGLVSALLVGFADPAR